MQKISSKPKTMSEEIKQTIKFPLRYNPYGQDVWDADDNLILDIRGWGRIQKMKDPEKKQDAVGEYVVKCLNEFEPLQQENQRLREELVKLTKGVKTLVEVYDSSASKEELTFVIGGFRKFLSKHKEE